MKKKIVFATNNKHKLEEVVKIVGDRFEILSLEAIGCNDDIEETADTLEGNAMLKAEYIFNKYGMDCFADDSGLEVEALNNAPGVYSARYAGEEKSSEKNMEKVLKELEGETNRNACFRTVIAVIYNGKREIFDGRVEGEIIKEKRGNEGFGYDPIFLPKGFDRTYAQMSMDEKNTFSHRAKASKMLMEFLNKNL